MPEFKVTLRQGQKTWVEYVEADTLEDVLSFYKAISTARVVKIEQIVYKGSDEFVPDDGNYWRMVKVIARRDGVARQYLFHNVRLSITPQKLTELLKQHLKVANGKIEGVVTVLWKR